MCDVHVEIEMTSKGVGEVESETDPERFSDSKGTSTAHGGTLPKPKKQKAVTGVYIYRTRYNPEWQSGFPIAFCKRKETVYNFYCGVCQKDISYRHHRRSDLKRHEKPKGHWSLSQACRAMAL